MALQVHREKSVATRAPVVFREQRLRRTTRRHTQAAIRQGSQGGHSSYDQTRAGNKAVHAALAYARGVGSAQLDRRPECGGGLRYLRGSAVASRSKVGDIITIIIISIPRGGAFSKDTFCQSRSQCEATGRSGGQTKFQKERREEKSDGTGRTYSQPTSSGKGQSRR